MAEITHLSCGDFSAAVSAHGAELQSLRRGASEEFLWQGDPAHWGRRAPLLFPIVGRARGDTIEIGDWRGTMPKHGFARDSDFALIEAGPQHCIHELRESEATLALWPFAFALTLTHELHPDGLSVRAEIENRAAAEMPVSFGFHPAFNWPMPGASGPHRILRHGGDNPPLHRLREGLLNPETRPSPFEAGALRLAPELFAEDAMIFRDAAGAGVTLAGESGPRLRVDFENLPDLGLWTKPGAPFICIEPWRGTDALWGGSLQMAERPGILMLAPGARADFAIRITIL